MIKFFRKIRQKLISENKFSKYLIYAVGEIMLVVVGILIALQINNWNEKQKAERLQDAYLERLISDVGQDTVNINYIISEIDLNQDAIQNLINSINSISDINTLDPIVKNYFKRGWVISEFVTTKNTYTDLSQTGNMNIIKNTELIDEIIQYYGWVKQVENSNSVNKSWITPIDQVVAEKTAAFELDPSTSALFSKKSRIIALENIYSHRELMERNAAGHYWINGSLSRNLVAIKGLSIDLLKSLENERQKSQ
jgi:hypothetical protein